MIDKIVKYKMISKIFDPLFNKDIKNIDNVINAVKHMISDSDMDMLMYMICTPNYVTLEQKDLVKWKPQSYEIKNIFELDRMKDAGLMDKQGFIYGKVINSADYDDNFNPFYYQMKVNAFILDKDNNMTPYEMDVQTLRLNKLRIHSDDLPDMIWEQTIENIKNGE